MVETDLLDSQLAAALNRCATGDRTALRVIYDAEAGRMIGVAMRILKRRDLAEEAAHDAFIRIWRGARGFDASRGTARSWIFAIVRNRALTILRAEGRFESDDGEERLEPDFLTAVDRLPENSALRRCLEALDIKHRSAVVYSYVFGLSHGELAGKMSVPLGTAKSWTRRGLLSLQECMG
ncbi:MAG: sigma-70 family RNA polymerase sigma factor [Pseudolabrys sp.]|nr:sigma-70 family RNA polymerase sigma factor [Pseudolabrys sp.]